MMQKAGQAAHEHNKEWCCLQTSLLQCFWELHVAGVRKAGCCPSKRPVHMIHEHASKHCNAMCPGLKCSQGDCFLDGCRGSTRSGGEYAS